MHDTSFFPYWDQDHRYSESWLITSSNHSPVRYPVRHDCFTMFDSRGSYSCIHNIDARWQATNVSGVVLVRNQPGTQSTAKDCSISSLSQKSKRIGPQWIFSFRPPVDLCDRGRRKPSFWYIVQSNRVYHIVKSQSHPSGLRDIFGRPKIGRLFDGVTTIRPCDRWWPPTPFTTTCTLATEMIFFSL